MIIPSNSNVVLVADDSLTIRKLVETVLTTEGYQVITAETGADCLARAAAEKPGLILLDYLLPDMQGTDVCRSLINSPETWEIPVLMMSSNGNAIRQLYQDLNNVADYLTKPFAPSVLKAVVAHLLQKDPPEENSLTPAVDGVNTTTGLSQTADANGREPSGANELPGVPLGGATFQKDFLDKVTRLISLMETQPNAGGTAAEIEAAPPVPVAKPKAKTRGRKSAAATPPEAVLRKFRLALQRHLRLRLRQIPDWEASRGVEDAEQFFIARILPKELLNDLSGDLLRATGMPGDAAGGLRCPASLVPVEAVLRHLQATGGTGELRLELPEEIVLLCYEQGEVVLITSNHPRHYCSGAACDFQAVPHAVIGDAVRAQQEQSLPFFVTLKNAGHLPPDAALDQLLREQGENCLRRAFKTPQAVAGFTPLPRLSSTVRSCKQSFPLNQLLLVCYRTVDDWFTLEKLFPDMEAAIVPGPDFAAQAEGILLNTAESRLLDAIHPGQTIPTLAESTGMKPFEVCQILYRFIKLGLLQQGSRVVANTRMDEALPVENLPAASTPAELATPDVTNTTMESAIPATPEESAADNTVSEVSLSETIPTASSTQTETESVAPEAEVIPTLETEIPAEPTEPAPTFTETEEISTQNPYYTN